MALLNFRKARRGVRTIMRDRQCKKLSIFWKAIPSRFNAPKPEKSRNFPRASAPAARVVLYRHIGETRIEELLANRPPSGRVTAIP